MTTVGYDMVLRGVTFRYGPYAEPVLKDLDLTVPYGDHLAIVGPSGIGKSTLAGLLCGLLRPGSGTVAFGDEIAADLLPERLAEIRTLIPQEAYVFASTIWDNLIYLCPTATARQVDNAVAALGAEGLVASLGGLHATFVPLELSAGQRQLLSLVRAYVSPAPVVVLDEATCHLDPAAERRVEEAFADRHGTLIVIAHRISSALRARRILVLDGTSAVVGDHLTLLATSPLYRELLGHWNAGSAPAAQPARSADLLGSVPASGATAHLVAARLKRNGNPVGPSVALNGVSFPPGKADEPKDNGSGSDRQRRLLIFGRVAESGNTPLAGVTLTLTDLSGQQLDRDFADSAGHYRLGPPTGGSYLVTCASATHQPTATMVTVADASVRRDIVLAGSGASLSGTVSAAETGEQPLEGAMVTLVDVHGDVTGAVRTRSDGRYTFPELAAGHYTLSIAAPSRQPVAHGIEISGTGRLTHDVEVVARVQLTGVVRSATSGTPVPEALAAVLAPDGRVVASAFTDAAGGFAFDDLDAGTYTLVASGYPAVAAEVQLRAGEPTDTAITLHPPTVDAVAPADAGATAEQGEERGAGRSDPAGFPGYSNGVNTRASVQLGVDA